MVASKFFSPPRNGRDFNAEFTWPNRWPKLAPHDGIHPAKCHTGFGLWEIKSGVTTSGLLVHRKTSEVVLDTHETARKPTFSISIFFFEYLHLRAHVSGITTQIFSFQMLLDGRCFFFKNLFPTPPTPLPLRRFLFRFQATLDEQSFLDWAEQRLEAQESLKTFSMSLSCVHLNEGHLGILYLLARIFFPPWNPTKSNYFRQPFECIQSCGISEPSGVHPNSVSWNPSLSEERML